MNATHPPRLRRRDHEARERREAAALADQARVERQHRLAGPARADGATIVALPGAVIREVSTGAGGGAELHLRHRRLGGSLVPRPTPARWLVA